MDAVIASGELERLAASDGKEHRYWSITLFVKSAKVRFQRRFLSDGAECRTTGSGPGRRIVQRIGRLLNGWRVAALCRD
jgi:hypothetical protein